MNTQKQAPLALKIVAALFIISGVFAALEVLVSLTHGRIELRLGVVGIFIGLGLLHFRRGWRTCALLFTWIVLGFIPFFVFLALAGERSLHFELFGQQVGETSPNLALLVAAVVFAITLWQYRILTRQDVVELFDGGAERGAAPNVGPAASLASSEAGKGPPSVS